MTTDIRVGDLIKATRRKDPEEHRQGRAVRVNENYVTFGSGIQVDRDHHAFELLDRPLPPIDEELLEKAVREYLSAAVANHPLGSIARKAPDSYYRHGVKAVINAVREYDKNATKENSK